MAVSINGVSAIVAKSWEWSLNNTLAMPPSIAAADGYGEILITKRDVKGSILIETELASVIDVDTLLTAGTRFAFASGTLGSVAGNRVVVSTRRAPPTSTDTNCRTPMGCACATSRSRSTTRCRPRTQHRLHVNHSMKQLTPYWFKPAYQVEGQPEVEFQLRPIDQRTHYACRSISSLKAIGVDGAFAAFDYAVIDWKGLPMPFSRQAKRELLSGPTNQHMTFWLFAIAGECYRRAQLSEDELKNS
jgi:hypothetical protein